MGSLLLLIIIATAATLWVRRVRAQRVRWLSRLALPGVWTCETPDGVSILEFHGDSGAGNYVERGAHATERGRWRVQGSRVVLATEQDERSYELRLFENGSIGVDGPGRERRVYARQRNNVVPLRQRN